MALGQVKIKILLAQDLLAKISGTKWSNPVKLDKQKEFGICFCVFFNWSSQSLTY